MNATFKRVIDKVAELPEEIQEAVWQQMLDYLNRLERLRAAVDEGIRSIERGEGRPLNMDGVLERARQLR